MAGYYRNPEATAEILRDGWLNTGDVGRFDADGYLWLSGRTRDVIVTAAGKNVHPEEVEARYRGLPGVEELVVVGLPDGRGRGESVCAVAVPSAGAGSGEDELERIRDAIADRSAGIPSYQRITRVELWRGELPKTTTFKVKRGRLRDALLAGEQGAPASAAGEPPAAARPDERPLGEAESWIVATVARLTGARADLLRPSTRLAEIGVDSLTRVELVGELEARFGLCLDEAAAGSLERMEDLLELRLAGDAPRSAVTGSSAACRPEPGRLGP